MVSKKRNFCNYGKEGPDTSPHAVIGQLSPSSLMLDCSLVDAASDYVDEDCNQHSMVC